MNEEWTKIAADAGISLLSALGGIVLGLWKWGHNSAREKQSVKDDYDAKIQALREEVRTSMGAQVQKVSEENDLLVGQFKEAFDGIRRQIDEHRFYTEKDFMKKEDFRDFRDEYREDMRELKATIGSMAKR